MSKILLPRAFEIASLQFPFLASLIERIVSGTLVAAAAIIKAIMEIGRLRPFKS